MSPHPTNGEENLWVKAIVNPKLYLKVPGQIIRIWGHDFVIQTDGSLCMNMHEDFVAAELKAGRIQKVSPPPGKEPEKMEKKITIVKEPPPGFTMDIGNYYGAGDLNALIEKVSELKTPAIARFAAERFPDKDKLKGKKDDMVDKIRSYIDSALLLKEEE